MAGTDSVFQTPESIVAADLDSDGQDELIADFGPGTGLRIYNDIGGGEFRWQTVSPPDGLGLSGKSNPGALAAGNLGTALRSSEAVRSFDTGVAPGTPGQVVPSSPDRTRPRM